MKTDWKKTEKHLYLPQTSPELIQVPAFRFFTIEGQGDPNAPGFAAYISVLFSLSYAVKMSPKKGLAPAGYQEFSVYPLEGIWDLTMEAKQSFDGSFHKDDLVFKLMIRQPGFVDEQFASFILEKTKKSKPHELLEKVRFEEITDGLCIQMLHLGSYDSEPGSFTKMEAFAEQEKVQRVSKVHREIYLSDARKVSAEKLKTVLRFQVSRSENSGV